MISLLPLAAPCAGPAPRRTCCRPNRRPGPPLPPIAAPTPSSSATPRPILRHPCHPHPDRHPGPRLLLPSHPRQRPPSATSPSSPSSPPLGPFSPRRPRLRHGRPHRPRSPTTPTSISTTSPPPTAPTPPTSSPATCCCSPSPTATPSSIPAAAPARPSPSKTLPSSGAPSKTMNPSTPSPPSPSGALKAARPPPLVLLALLLSLKFPLPARLSRHPRAPRYPHPQHSHPGPRAPVRPSASRSFSSLSPASSASPSPFFSSTSGSPSSSPSSPPPAASATPSSSTSLAPLHRGWVGFLSYLPSLLVVLLVFFFAFQVLKLTRLLFREVERGTVRLARLLPGVGHGPPPRIVDVPHRRPRHRHRLPLPPRLGLRRLQGRPPSFSGVLLSLGSSTAIANIVAGVLLTYTRAFRVGDRVQIADTHRRTSSSRPSSPPTSAPSKTSSSPSPMALVLASHIINFSPLHQGPPPSSSTPA